MNLANLNMTLILTFDLFSKSFPHNDVTYQTLNAYYSVNSLPVPFFVNPFYSPKLALQICPQAPSCTIESFGVYLV